MRIALGQINPTIGDLRGNCQLIEQAHRGASDNAAQLLVVPELAVSGYPPKDLLLRDCFIGSCDAAVQQLAGLTVGKAAILVGHPSAGEHGSLHNSASLLADGKIVARVHKTLLPNYDVFDERRYFRPQRPDQLHPIEFQGRKLGIHLCEDAWWGQPETFYHIPEEHFVDPVRELARLGADVLINLSASPFEGHKPARRRGIIAAHAKAALPPRKYSPQAPMPAPPRAASRKPLSPIRPTPTPGSASPARGWRTSLIPTPAPSATSCR